jgi:hypothetical protein
MGDHLDSMAKLPHAVIPVSSMNYSKNEEAMSEQA